MNAQLTLLGLLAIEPNYGYELKKLYDQFFGRDKPILTGQIYSTLNRLVRDHKVEPVPAVALSADPAVDNATDSATAATSSATTAALDTASTLAAHIKAKATAKPQGPSQIQYQITPDGLATLHTWLTTPEEIGEHLRSTFYCKVMLALLVDGDPHQYIDSQRHAHLTAMRQLVRRQLATPDVAEQLLLDGAIYHIDADLKWMDKAEGKIDNIRRELCQK